ncbi:MAG: alanine--tRNA ligase [Alphaproteobacteria bacterium]|nr:alanine--tRNA ligase [Alphaproteobacteria bacterium]
MSSDLADIRARFLDYFAAHDHKVVPSASLVPLSDPTLLFTNAGMVPFKDYFTGQNISPMARAVSSQKCVRAGGKHNDLDNVGYTARHHTFFEMLGNFSFGDYFKEEAIFFAWEFLIKELQLPPEKLFITVYAEDDEAQKLWKKIAGVSDDKIIRIATDDNFWAMGEIGPCGPCSEIFYDHGEGIAGGPPGSPTEDGDRFIEIWNLVFMQYDQQSDGTRLALPKPSIDTGMGLERISAVLQGTHDNYETDLMRHLIAASADLSHQAADGQHSISHRVIADHLRSSAFLIADGVLPSNEGRGYVLRRIMRRAMRHAHLLGVEEPFLWRVFPALKTQMAAAFPEIERADALITETLRHEEMRFREMLGRGLKLLDDEMGNIKGDTLAGDVAFKLYDTFGFPLDLTQDALRDVGRKVDVAGFEVEMEKQRAAARTSWAGSGSAATDTIWFDLHNKHGATEFVGYQSTQAEGQVQAILVDGEEVQSAKQGAKVEIIFNQTPFYGESGGQVGDVGTISDNGGLSITITNTQKQVGALHVLCGEINSGTLKCGAQLHQSVDASRRTAIRANHSATHLLHEALRRVLGAHVSQKGSLVNDKHLRFDFSHPKAMTAEEICKAEIMVNDMIRQNDAVTTRLMSPEEAIEAGALALFGEKYGEEVRVLAMGADTATPHGNYSVELCGGTHVQRLGDIGILKITSEGAVASGVRRIEACTGGAAVTHTQTQNVILQDIADNLKIGVADIAPRVAQLLSERKKLERELEDAKRRAALQGTPNTGADNTTENVRDIGGIKFLARCIDDLPAKHLRELVDEGKAKIGSGVVVFIGIDNNKAGIAVGVTDDLTDRYDAVELVRIGAEKLGGKGGGGRADMAQAGGSDITGGAAALDAIAATL